MNGPHEATTSAVRRARQGHLFGASTNGNPARTRRLPLQPQSAGPRSGHPCRVCDPSARRSLHPANVVRWHPHVTAATRGRTARPRLARWFESGLGLKRISVGQPSFLSRTAEERSAPKSPSVAVGVKLTRRRLRELGHALTRLRPRSVRAAESIQRRCRMATGIVRQVTGPWCDESRFDDNLSRARRRRLTYTLRGYKYTE